LYSRLLFLGCSLFLFGDHLFELVTGTRLSITDTTFPLGGTGLPLGGTALPLATGGFLAGMIVT
jgi:hypothetical protein